MTLIPSVIRIDIPAIDRWIEFLRSRDTLQQQLNALTAQLADATGSLERAVTSQPTPKE